MECHVLRQEQGWAYARCLQTNKISLLVCWYALCMCNFDYPFICPSHHKSKCPRPGAHPNLFFHHSYECIRPTLQILNLSKNEKGIKFSIKLKFLMSAPSYINCTLKSGKFSIFNQILNQKNQSAVALPPTWQTQILWNRWIWQLCWAAGWLHIITPCTLESFLLWCSRVKL